MRHGGMGSVSLHAPRGLCDLPQAPKEGFGTLEQLWLAFPVSPQPVCRAKDTMLAPDFGKNGRADGGECGMVGWVLCRCMLPEASVTCPRHLRKDLEHLNRCGWPSLCHHSPFAVPRTPCWTLGLAKMGVRLAVNAAWWDGNGVAACSHRPL